MTEQQIQLLIEMDIEVWEAYLPYLSAQMKQQIVLGAFSGLTAEQIVANIGSATLTGNQVATMVTTTLNNYSRSINLMMMNEAPANTLYQYHLDQKKSLAFFEDETILWVKLYHNLVPKIKKHLDFIVQPKL